MAYNGHDLNRRLTSKQEEFCQQLMMGKTQYEAYRNAYPKTKTWKRSTVDWNASMLAKQPNIQKRLQELGWRDAKKVEWTRQKALETINKAMEMHQQDMERIEKAYQEDLDRKDMELKQWVNLLTVENVDKQRVQKHINQLLDEMSDLRKVRRINAVNTRGIYEGAKILNRMFGFDITKVEINQEDEERKKLEEIDIDKLEVIADAILNGRKSNKSAAG